MWPDPRPPQHGTERRLSRLRALARERVGCRAFFDGEAELKALVTQNFRAILVQGWLQSFETGEDVGEPESDMERETLQDARALQRQSGMASLLCSNGCAVATKPYFLHCELNYSSAHDTPLSIPPSTLRCINGSGTGARMGISVSPVMAAPRTLLFQ